MERNDGTVNQDPGDVNATTESNRQFQDNVSNPAETNCNDRNPNSSLDNDRNPNSSLDQSIDRDSNHKFDGRYKKLDADSIQTNVNQKSNSTFAPGRMGNGHEMNKGNANMKNETEKNAHFDHSKSKQMENIFGKEKERNHDNGTCEIKSKDGNNKTNREKKGEILCPKKEVIENEQSCNKGTGPDTNTNEDKQVFSHANRKTVEEKTSSVEIIIQVVSEIDNEPLCGDLTEPVGSNTEDKRGMKQETLDNPEKDLKLNDLTNETAQTTNEAVKVQSEDEIYDLPTLNNTGDTSPAVQNGGDQNNCSNEPPRDTSDPLVEDVNKDCVEIAPNNIGDNCESIETTEDNKNNSSVKIFDEPTPSITIYSRCYCCCCHCGRLRCCNRCCRLNDNAPVCHGTDQNCSGHNKEPHTSSVNEPTGPVSHINCQNCSRPNVNEPTDPVNNCHNQNCSRPNESNNEPGSNDSFRPTNTSSPLKRKTNVQNALEVTPSKRRKLFHDEDPNNENGDGDNTDNNNTHDTVCERNNGQTRDNDDNERNSGVCEICHNTSKTKYETCHHNTRCETCDRQNGYEPSYCGQNCRTICKPRSSRSRCDYWANNKTTQTNDECIANPNEKSTQTCSSYVKDEGKTFTNDTQVFGEKSWADNKKSNPKQTERKLGKQSFDKQHSDDLYRNNTQPPVKKRKENKDITKYEQYHHNAYLNYYVRLFREERFQGIRASEVAKYAGYEWSSRMSEKEKRPYYEMRKLAPPRIIKTKNKKINKYNMMEQEN